MKNQAKTGFRMKPNELNHLFTTIIDITQKPVFVTNGTGEVIFLNNACAALFGKPQAELMGRSYAEIFPEETVRQMLNDDHRVLKDGVEICIETWIAQEGDSSLFYTMTKTPYRNDRGENVGVIHRNISGRSISEHVLIADRKAMEKELRFITEAGTILASSLDFQKTLNAVRKIAVPHFGDFCFIDLIEPDGHEVPQGVTPAVISDDVIRTKLPVLFSAFKTFQESYSPAEVEQGRPDLLRQLAPHSAIIVPLIHRDSVKGVMHLFCSDSGRKYEASQTDLALKFGRRIASALESARLYQASLDAVATRDEFISIAAHELKTPITALKLQTQLIKASLDPLSNIQIPKDRLASLVNNSDQQIDRLSRLISDLFDVSGLNQGQLKLRYERFDFRELILEILEHFNLELKSTGSTIDLDAPAPIIGNWDRVRMEQVMRNLIGNAIKYGRGRPIHISAWLEAGHTRLHIQDQGIGIDDEKRNLIFERFKRGDCGPDVRGLGLGLYIVRQILVAHGGHVHVRSEAGQGSTFIIEIPTEIPAEDPTAL